MSKHNPLHFIAVLLLAFALGLGLAPICRAQLADESSSGKSIRTLSREVRATMR
jgi:hypothetical protein